MAELEGKTAAVFGAGSSGDRISIGRAIAHELARQGAQVLCLDRSLANASETATAIQAEGLACSAAEADVTNPESLVAALAEFGRIDIGVFNVGVQTLGRVEDLSREAWDATFAANVTGAFNCAKALLPGMKAAGGGSLVFVSSIASVLSSKTPNVAYGSSKAALNLFARSVAVNYAADGIRSNVVMPGLIDTPMVRSAFSSDPDEIERIMQERSRRCPSGRMGTAQEVAMAVAFLASDRASYISGATIPVDGALSCQMS